MSRSPIDQSLMKFDAGLKLYMARDGKKLAGITLRKESSPNYDESFWKQMGWKRCFWPVFDVASDALPASDSRKGIVYQHLDNFFNRRFLGRARHENPSILESLFVAEGTSAGASLQAILDGGGCVSNSSSSSSSSSSTPAPTPSPTPTPAPLLPPPTPSSIKQERIDARANRLRAIYDQRAAERAKIIEARQRMQRLCKFTPGTEFYMEHNGKRMAKLTLRHESCLCYLCVDAPEHSPTALFDYEPQTCAYQPRKNLHLQHVFHIFNKRILNSALPRNTDPLSVLYVACTNTPVLSLLTSLDDVALAMIGWPTPPSLEERLASVRKFMHEQAASKLPCSNCGGDHEVLVEHRGVDLCTGCLGTGKTASASETPRAPVSVAQRVAAIESNKSKPPSLNTVHVDAPSNNSSASGPSPFICPGCKKIFTLTFTMHHEGVEYCPRCASERFSPQPPMIQRLDRTIANLSDESADLDEVHWRVAKIRQMQQELAERRAEAAALEAEEVKLRETLAELATIEERVERIRELKEQVAVKRRILEAPECK